MYQKLHTDNLCGHLVIWSFVKIENGWCQKRHYNISILYLYIVSNDRISEIENDQMTTKMALNACTTLEKVEWILP